MYSARGELKYYDPYAPVYIYIYIYIAMCTYRLVEYPHVSKEYSPNVRWRTSRLRVAGITIPALSDVGSSTVRLRKSTGAHVGDWLGKDSCFPLSVPSVNSGSCNVVVGWD